MPAVAMPKDDCLTAEDVRKRAQEVHQRRMGLRALPVRQMQAEIRPPAPRPVEKPVLRVTVHFGYPNLPVNEYKSFKFAIIQKACCAAGGITMNEMQSRIRAAHLVKVRQIAMLLCKMLGPADLSLPRIAARFAGRDHTTVLHAIRKLEPVREALERRVAKDAPLQEYVSAAFDAWDEFIQPRADAMWAAARRRAKELARTPENRWTAK